MELNAGAVVQSRYEVIRPLGRGGMATTYRARDRLGGDEVALKVLHTTSPRQWQVLSEEFGRLCALHHPNLTRVRDLGSERRGDAVIHFYTADVIDGVSLDRYAREHRWPEVERALVDVLAALASLHRLSTRHGDVKPANVIVDSSGRGTLIDLGCAGPFGPPRDDRVSGTPGFLAPELLAGQAVDGRADLFAYGVTLRQLLDHVEAPPDHVKGLVRRLTARRPSGRPSTAEEVLEALGGDPLSLGSLAGRAPKLVGRDDEMAFFQDLLDAFIAGERGPRVLRVIGPSGVGRSRVLREMKWVAQTRCVAIEGVLSSPQPLASLLRLATGDDTITDDVQGILRAHELLLRAKEPTVLVLDDVDLLSEDGDLLLGALIRILDDDDPLFLITSASEPSTGSTVAVESQLRLEPLGAPEVHQWAKEIIQPDQESRVLELTGGFPVSLEALLSVMSEPGVQEQDLEIVGARLMGAAIDIGDLDDPSRRALCVISVRDGALDDDDRKAHGVSDVALLQLARLGWLRIDGTRWKLVRLADRGRIIDALPRELIQTVHLEVVEQLRDRLSRDQGLTDGERSRVEAALANHLFAAGKESEAAEALVEGAAYSRRDPSAWSPVAALISNQSKDPQVLLAVAEVDHLSGRAERALQTLAQIICLDPTSAVIERLRIQAAACYLKLGQPKRARRQLERALQPTVTDDLHSEIADMLSRVMRQQGAYREALVTAKNALGRCTDPGVLAALHEDVGVAASYLGDGVLATRHLAEATRLCVDSPRAEVRVRSYRAIHSFRSGRFEEAIDQYSAALEVAEEHHLSDLVANASLNLGTALQQSSDWGAALASYERGLRIAVALGKAGTERALRFNIANLQVDIGLFERAEPVVHDVRSAAREAGALFFESSTSLVLGVIAMARGELDEALEWFQHADRACRDQGTPREEVEVDIHLAEVALARHDLTTASQHLDAARDRGNLGDAPDLEARLLLLLGALDEARGEPAGALHNLELARKLAQRTTHRAHEAEIETALAEVYALQDAQGLAEESRSRARNIWERMAASLPVSLRDAFWSHPRRARLPRSTTEETPKRAGPDLRRFLAVNRRINSILDVQAVVEYAMDAAIELTGAERGFLLLVSTSIGVELEVRAARNIDRHHVSEPQFEFSRTIAQQVIDLGDPIVTTDATHDDRFREQASVDDMKLRSVACVPIRSPEGTLGALYLDNRRRRGQFAPDDIDLLVAFADQVAIALRNARILEQLESHARELEDRAEKLEKAKAQIEKLMQGQELEIERLNEELRSRQQVLELRYDYSNIIYRGPAMRAVLSTVDRVVNQKVSVLIQGESGTGKELIARAIHFNSERRDHLFQGINCAALPENLLESELFGHVRGAFTGAERDREGLLVAASGGTLFLDELGEMPLTMQAKLLRALQERVVSPLGSSHTVSIDIRLLCATNRSLLDLVEGGRFREDLYYRIAVIELTLPPLRDRLEDLPALTHHILARLATDANRPPPRCARDVIPALARHPWPGNVRQLENVLTRAYVMAGRDRLRASDLELHRVSTQTLAADREQFEREEARRILAALNANRWNVRAVSRALGIPSNTLYRKLKRYNIQRP